MALTATDETTWMTTEEVAKYLKITDTTIRRMVRDGELRQHKLGKRAVRYHRDDVEGLLVPSAAQ